VNFIKKISCIHCTKEFRKREIKSDKLCESCYKHACLLCCVFNYGCKELFLMIDNSNDPDKICSKYESLCDFAQRELEPWYNYNCLPQITQEKIKTLQDKINQKLLIQKNVSLDNLQSQSRL